MIKMVSAMIDIFIKCFDIIITFTFAIALIIFIICLFIIIYDIYFNCLNKNKKIKITKETKNYLKDINNHD